MSEAESFLPEIEEAYLALHEWLSVQPKACGYRSKSICNKAQKLLSASTLLSAAAQYYVYFPAHFFKVSYTLNKVIGSGTLTSWLQYNPRVCLVDIGCGAGAASAAFVNSILSLQQSDAISQRTEICSIGIDINPSAIALYNQVMCHLKLRVEPHGLDLNYRLIPYGNLQALSHLKDFLDQQRSQWKQPCLSQVFIMQVNVVSPFSQRYREVSTEYNELSQLGVDLGLLGNYHQAFGREEAAAYKQLLEDVGIDQLYIITIGTQGWENRVQEMSEAIDKEFNTSKHKVERIGTGQHRVDYILPKGCYWREWKNELAYRSEFSVDVSAIANVELEDPDWVAVKDIGNLRLAWARARHHILDESLADEVEIRLFESSLEENFTRLQQQLIAYASDIAQTGDRVTYGFPKRKDEARPRGLSRIEEEILSTALIQRLGPKVGSLTSRSFAYRFARNYGDGETEYLYEYWLTAYSRFLEDACLEASKYESGVVIRADIKSFFTRIIRDQLRDIAAERLTKSQRIEWLIRLLLSRDLDGHDAGLGIVQGNIGSGFFANLYLLSLDSRFATSNEWNVEFSRYVDDMIVILPDPRYESEVIGAIRAELGKLGLELNDSKTKVMPTQDFVKDASPDESIQGLQERFSELLVPFWIMNNDNRTAFRKYYSDTNDQWWYQVSIYRRCLDILGLYFSDTIISRRVCAYLFNQARCIETLKGRSELSVPPIPTEGSSQHIAVWRQTFEERNPDWLQERDKLRIELKELLHDSLTRLGTRNPTENPDRKLMTRLRFAANRLAQIGFDDDSIWGLVDVLRRSPWLLRDITSIVESLARQQCLDPMKLLLSSYLQMQDEVAEYMKAITLRSIRFLDCIDEELWSEISESAVGSSFVNCLLASETWLHVGHRCRQFIDDKQINSIRLAYESTGSSRLRKNYLLILARFGDLSDDGAIKDESFLVRQAFTAVMSGQARGLFDYQEPDIIRHSFYSGLRASERYEESEY